MESNVSSSAITLQRAQSFIDIFPSVSSVFSVVSISMQLLAFKIEKED